MGGGMSGMGGGMGGGRLGGSMPAVASPAHHADLRASYGASSERELPWLPASQKRKILSANTSSESSGSPAYQGWSTSDRSDSPQRMAEPYAPEGAAPMPLSPQRIADPYTPECVAPMPAVSLPTIADTTLTRSRSSSTHSGGSSWSYSSGCSIHFGGQPGEAPHQPQPLARPSSGMHLTPSLLAAAAAELPLITPVPPNSELQISSSWLENTIGGIARSLQTAAQAVEVEVEAAPASRPDPSPPARSTVPKTKQRAAAQKTPKKAAKARQGTTATTAGSRRKRAARATTAAAQDVSDDVEARPNAKAVATPKEGCRQSSKVADAGSDNDEIIDVDGRGVIRQGGKYSDWVLELGTKDRNLLYKSSPLSPDEKKELVKRSRQHKQAIAHKRYRTKQRGAAEAGETKLAKGK